MTTVAAHEGSGTTSASTGAGVSMHSSRRFYGEACTSQRILPPAQGQRMEGVAFCDNGRVLAAVLSDSDEVCLYRRAQGTVEFDPRPFCRLRGPSSRMNYPHDVSFSLHDDGRLLAVAQRSGSVLLFARDPGHGTYGPAPVCVLSGPESELQYSDGVAFVPPHGDMIAVCNLPASKLTFHRRRSVDATQYELRPSFTLQHNGIVQPDGIAFSSDGRWLAVANHSAHSVAIFSRAAANGRSTPVFDPSPYAVLQDRSLRFAHSVAFSPRYNHLVVSNAGANYASIYVCSSFGSGSDASAHWTVPPSQQLLAGNEKAFAEVNACNKKEGGPKGVAMTDDLLAVCRPETGLTLYRLQEGPQGIALQARRNVPLDTVPRRRDGLSLGADDRHGYVLRRNGEPVTRVNDAGALVWQLCGGDHTLAQLIARLQTSFPDAAQLPDDVQAAVTSLHEAGAIDLGP